MDWITNRAGHKGFLGVTVGEEICTDLDYADDASQHVGNTSPCSRNTARGVFTNWTRNQLE